MIEDQNKINRQDFLKYTGLGICACAATLCPGVGLAKGIMQDSTHETPINEKMNFAQIWVKRFFDVLDSQLDESTRKKLMEENGKRCFQGSSPSTEPPIKPEEFVQKMQGWVGKENCRMEGNIVYFNYVSNPRGLRVADGYCLCPIVEKGPEGLSGTYCQCSVGYVHAMFEKATGKKVSVELLESLKRGGKGCKFKITLVS